MTAILLLASNNMNKYHEMRAILGTQLSIGTEYDISHYPPENANSFSGNALIKAQYAWSRINNTDALIIADDSGLVIPALNGEPGIHSARYGNSAHYTLNAHERNRYILKKLNAHNNRNAYYVCALIAYYGTEQFFCIQETWHIQIAYTIESEHGFGYDPISVCIEKELHGQYVSQLSTTQKNTYSHRGKALRKLRTYLLKQHPLFIIQENKL